MAEYLLDHEAIKRVRELNVISYGFLVMGARGRRPG